MFKKTLYIIGLAALVSLVLVGCGKSQDSSQSSKTNGAGPTSKKVAASSTTSTSSSSMSSTSGSNQTNAQSLDDKTIGLLAYEWVQDEQAKAEAPKANSTVSIDSLVKTYYSTPAQKQHVNNFGNSILTEDEWNKQYNK